MSPQKKPTLRETALKTQETNPSQLGDPISLKAETADSEPTSSDRGASSSSSPSSRASSAKEHLKKTAPAPTKDDGDTKDSKGGKQTLRQKAMQKLEENPSQLGDPVSLKAEKADSQPTDQDRGAAAGKSKL